HLSATDPGRRPGTPSVPHCRWANSPGPPGTADTPAAVAAGPAAIRLVLPPGSGLHTRLALPFPPRTTWPSWPPWPFGTWPGTRSAPLAAPAQRLGVGVKWPGGPPLGPPSPPGTLASPTSTLASPLTPAPGPDRMLSEALPPKHAPESH